MRASNWFTSLFRMPLEMKLGAPNDPGCPCAATADGMFGIGNTASIACATGSKQDGLIVFAAVLMQPAGANGDVVSPRDSSIRLPWRISGVGTTAVCVSAFFVRVA